MLKKTSLACALSVLALSQAQAFTPSAVFGFTGYFAPANWTLTLDSLDGSVNTAGAPANVVIISPDDGSEAPGSTDYTIIAPSNGTVTFTWNYQSNDTGGGFPISPQFDPFGYLNNTLFTQLSTNTPGEMIQSGTIAFAVFSGQTFGFSAKSVDNGFGSASTTVSEFSFVPSTEDIPFGVDSTVGLSVLGLAAAFKFRRRKSA